jgi:hypothetical protein
MHYINLHTFMKTYFAAICVVSSFTNVLSKNFRGGHWKSSKTTHHKDFEVHDKRACATKNGRTGSKREEFDLYKNVSYNECETMCLGLGTKCYGFEYTESASRCEVWKVEIYTSHKQSKNRKCHVHKKATGTKVDHGRPTPCPASMPKPTPAPTYILTKAGPISFTKSLYKAIDSDIALLRSTFSSYVDRSQFMAGIVRLVAHDFMDYDRLASDSYGPDGCFDPAHEANAGLPEKIWCDDCELKVLYETKYQQFVGKADFWIAAANAAIRQTSVDNILDLENTFTWGRVDRNSCPGSGDRIPRPGSCSEVEDAFLTRMGLNWVDVAALMGAHSLGIGDENVRIDTSLMVT